jgi:hypothetical protein
VITGAQSTLDRLIFKGHLAGFYPQGAFARFFISQHVLLKDFATYAETTSEQLKAHAQQVAAVAHRPYGYLAAASTATSGPCNEAQACVIAKRDRLTEGLICVFAPVLPCRTFTVRGSLEMHRLEVVRENRNCLHLCCCYLHREFGFMSERLQSWFLFTLQICVNGRGWLAQQLDQDGIAYQRYDNKLTQVADLPAAQALSEKFAHRHCPTVLDAFGCQVNPLLPTLRRAGFRSYFWSVDRAEYKTDVLCCAAIVAALARPVAAQSQTQETIPVAAALAAAAPAAPPADKPSYRPQALATSTQLKAASAAARAEALILPASGPGSLVFDRGGRRLVDIRLGATSAGDWQASQEPRPYRRAPFAHQPGSFGQLGINPDWPPL